ncbi:hypothetical protein BDR04DRAFT_1165254 [Suillus decipiens]|nr:hypothetical protein BDR04DRAFT_1165254 [Suillus decipiens]
MSCQTYEAGFSSASQPYFSPEPEGPPTLLYFPRLPLGEARAVPCFAKAFALAAISEFQDAAAMAGADARLGDRNWWFQGPY